MIIVTLLVFACYIIIPIISIIYYHFKQDKSYISFTSTKASQWAEYWTAEWGYQQTAKTDRVLRNSRYVA